MNRPPRFYQPFATRHCCPKLGLRFSPAHTVLVAFGLTLHIHKLGTADGHAERQFSVSWKMADSRLSV